jgi:late competence protein required for DNA uptake (superfamily II DNA/RNA helicase)
MENEELEIRFNYYLKTMCGDVQKPLCSECDSEYAEVTDLAEGEVFCKSCLMVSLKRDMDFFIVSTQGYK